MLAEKIRFLLNFLACDSEFGTYLCSRLVRRRRIFHVMMVKVSSFPFRSVVSISWSEFVQLIRVCSRFIKAFVQAKQKFWLKKYF